MPATVVEFYYGSNSYELAVSVLHFSEDVKLSLISTLSEEERCISDSFSSIKRLNEFVYGRVAAKEALYKLNDSENYVILNNENGKPFVVDSDFDVSISHSRGTVIAIAFPKNFSFGIDLEYFNPKRINALRRLSPNYSSLRELTALWTMKEALSKAIFFGLTENFEKYEEQEFIFYKNVGYQCKFKHFCPYQGFAFCDNIRSIGLAFRSDYKVVIPRLIDFFKENV